MKYFRITFFIVLFAHFIVLSTSYAGLKSNIKIFRRFENGCGYSCIQELTADIAIAESKTVRSRVVMQFCSKESLPVAISSSATVPNYFFSILSGALNYESTKLFYARSENCLGKTTDVVPFEILLIPEGEEIPSSNQIVEFCRVKEEFMDVDNKIGEQKTVEKIKNVLDVNREAIALVVGRFYEKPNPEMKRKLKAFEKAFKQSKVQQKRYTVFLTKWTSEYDDTEPKTPYIKIFYIKENCY